MNFEVMVAVSEEKIKAVGSVLNNAQRPLKERFRALFTLRSIGGKVALDEMAKAFTDPSALLKHEVAYCIGQMGMPEAIKILEEVLADESAEPIVRHEAGEALGAIGKEDSLPVLRAHLTDPVSAVADTCRLAVDRIEWLHGEGFKEEGDKLSKNPYNSVDPAPPALEQDTDKLTETLLNEDLDIFTRYRAMFSLRNKGDPDSIMALTKGLKSDHALFRHEIAYVLGQIHSELTEAALGETLSDTNEHEMVRHEAAEALGSIGTDSVNRELNKYLDKQVPAVIRESCVVALDIMDYNNSEEFKSLQDTV